MNQIKAFISQEDLVTLPGGHPAGHCWFAHGAACQHPARCFRGIRKHRRLDWQENRSKPVQQCLLGCGGRAGDARHTP